MAKRPFNGYATRQEQLDAIYNSVTKAKPKTKPKTTAPVKEPKYKLDPKTGRYIQVK